MPSRLRLYPPVLYVFVCAVVLASSGVFAQEKAAKIDALMSRYHENRQFNGTVLVAEGGKVIYKKGFGLANVEWGIPNTPDTKFRLGSVTKQFTAAVVLQLVEEGRLRLDGKIADYLPEYPRKTGTKVSIHQLLNHTSGIPSYTGFSDFFEKKSRDPYTPTDFIKIFSELDLEFEPGSRFNYNNSAYFLLGVIIEKITGQTYEQVLQERVFKPLKMTSSGYDLHRSILGKRAGAYTMTLDGFENAPYLDMTIPFAAGSLYSTVEDLYLWDQALYSDKPLSSKSKELMFKPTLQNYGYGVFVRSEGIGQGDRKVTVIGHGGGINGFNTLLERIVDDRHLLVLLNNTGGTRLGEMSGKIRSILYDQKYAEPTQPISQEMYKTYNQKGLEAAIQQYRELKAKQQEAYDFGPLELNALGRHLLQLKKTAHAIEFLKLNVEAHPENANAHASLGDAYRESGSKELAVKSYARALELNPNNRSLADRIKNTLDKE